MKHFQRIVWVVLAFGLALLIFVAFAFKVDDMTLSKGESYEFNTNWVMTWPDGKSVSIEELPYSGESAPGEWIIFESTIPKEYFGKTMAFLSADKELKIWMDEELVYEFGVGDKRYFGHTPGSVYNFVNIPYDLKAGKVRMEMMSPYDNYAAKVTDITVGDRDVLILNLLQDNIGYIILNVVILVCGIIFLLLFIIQLASKQDTHGMQYLFGYCVVASLYYFVETKTLHIFYGNQTVYSVLVFLCLMMMPFFISLYYANGELGVYKLRWKIMAGLMCANIAVQMVLQLTNLVDFMNMAFFSHALIALTVLMVAISYIQIVRVKRDKSIIIGMCGLLFMGIGGTIDIVRLYVVAVGDMGEFSRLGTTCFSIIMLYQHFSYVIKGYSNNIQENARLLKEQVDFVEKKNEQLKKANELAEEARQDAIAANAAKDKFLAHMSHEIRTPINAVLGMDTMILRESSEMHVKEYALDIQNAGQNLLALINDILDFSKIESGKLEIINVEYDFSSLIHDISNMIKAKAEAKKLNLHICVDNSLPSKLLGDDVRVRQVLVNLLNNAVKYTQQGSVTLNVEGRTEGRKAILEFAVKDTGIGIKEEDISKLYKEFERIEEKRNRNIEGTGLGINITTQLLQLMGSKLNVSSVYGEGSCFSFTLEQQIVDSTPIGNLEERIKAQSTEYSYTSAYVAPEARVLVVDDNPTNLKVFVSLLKPTKIMIDVADGGKVCLEMIQKNHYDIIFLDHMMPEMDGIETLHRMKDVAGNQCEGSPVVALTANAITGAKEMYIAEGFDAFLPKPINPEKLEQLILKLLPRELLLFDAVSETEELKVNTNIHTVLEEPELPMVDGIDWAYGFSHLPNMELFMSTLRDFYKVLELEADSLDGFYVQLKDNPEAITQYRIKVHAMKSSANLIGAIMLGGMAKLLENAAADGNVELINALHNVFIKEWRGYKDKLKDCVVQENTSSEQLESGMENKTDVIAYLQRLQVAMEDMDVDVMDEIMSILEKYSYPDEIQSEVEKLSGYVTNMDDDGGIPVIQKIMKLMES
ncbi:MAG: response regulator [Lachnospira sp.]|nr:response regulator [Lachnospira sp.]